MVKNVENSIHDFFLQNKIADTPLSLNSELSKNLADLIFNANVDNAIQKEKTDKKNDLLGLKNYSTMDWDNYFKFGAFPSVMHDTNYRNSFKKLYYSVESVVTKDLGVLSNLTVNSQTNALRLIKFMAEKIS